MLGGGTSEGITTFGRIAATIPARRGLEAIERLADLYRRDRADTETPEQFFRRMDLAVAKVALEPIPRLTPETATAGDFIDLGDEAAFDVQVMDGECSA